MPTAYTILLAITAVVALLTWLVPASKYIQLIAGDEDTLVYLPLDRDRLYKIELGGDNIDELRLDYANELTDITIKDNPGLKPALLEVLTARLLL